MSLAQYSTVAVKAALEFIYTGDLVQATSPAQVPFGLVLVLHID